MILITYSLNDARLFQEITEDTPFIFVAKLLESYEASLLKPTITVISVTTLMERDVQYYKSLGEEAKHCLWPSIINSEKLEE